MTFFFLSKDQLQNISLYRSNGAFVKGEHLRTYVHMQVEGLYSLLRGF